MIVNLRTLSFGFVCNLLRMVSTQDPCYGEMCFTLHESKLNFQYAKASCQSTSFKLLAVTDNATQYRLSAYLSYLKKNSTYYVDIKRQEASYDTWYLVNGSTFDGAVTGQDNRASLYKLYGSLSVVYNSWGMFASNPNWNQNYICEFNETKCSQFRENDLVYNGRCYVRFETVNLTWFVAREKCISSGGDLGTFNYPNDHFPLDISWLNPALSYWTGIRWKNRSWITPSDSDNEIVYTQWSNGKPSEYYSYECVCLDPNGNPPWSWTDCECKQQRSFICLQGVPTTTITITTPTTSSTQMEKISSTTSSTRKVAVDSTAISSDKATQEGKATSAIGLGVSIGGAFLILVVVVVVVLVIRSKSKGKGKSVGITSNSGELNTASYETATEDTDGGTYAVVVPNTQTKEAIKKEEVTKEVIYAIPVFEQNVELSESRN